MKKILSQIHRSSKGVFIAGWMVVLVMLAASTVLYIGAGNVFDYYISVEISEKLLSGVRPVCIAVCLVSLTIEYLLKNRNNSLN